MTDIVNNSRNDRAASVPTPLELASLADLVSDPEFLRSEYAEVLEEE